VDVFDKAQTPEGVVGGELRSASLREEMKTSIRQRELAATSDDCPLTVKHLIKWV